ncbi:MAG: thiamine pyrophosphate-binding protein [bacterium]
MDCAQVLLEGIRGMGGKRIYGVVGTSNVAFMDALYDYQSDLRYVSCRHEQVAASMADTEGRLTGTPGVALTHSGPGTLNALISVAAACKDCSPMICLSGAVKRKLRGGEGMLEVDHLRIFESLCKGVFRIDHAGDAAAVFSEAYRRAVSGAPGPVLIEVPEDVWKEPAGESAPAFDLRAAPKPAPSGEDVRACLDRLKQAARPLLVSGGGVARGQCAEEMLRFCEALQAPVVTTGNGRGTVPETHPLCLGRVGFGGGTSAADQALARADAILAVGCTLSDMTTYEYTWPPGGEVMVVDIDPRALGSGPCKTRLRIRADAARFLGLALQEVAGYRPPSRAEWLDQLEPVRREWQTQLDNAVLSDKVPLSPGRVIHELSRLLQPEHIVAVGAGMHQLYPMAFLPCVRPLSFLASVNFGAMGFGFAASLAAKLVHPHKQVVAVLGDGDFMMTLQDLETAVREKIRTVVLVVNDGMYRVLNFRQRIQHRGRVLGTCHGNPDFAGLARSFGAAGWRLERPAEIRPVLGEALQADVPAVVDVIVDPDDFPPFNVEAALRMGMAGTPGDVSADALRAGLRERRS